MQTRWTRCKSSSPKAKRPRASFFRQSDGAIRPYKAFDPVGDVPLRRLFAALAALAAIVLDNPAEIAVARLVTFLKIARYTPALQSLGRVVAAERAALPLIGQRHRWPRSRR